MITTAGKALIRSHLTGTTDKFAESIGIGIGNAAAEVTDSGLSFEVARYPISVRYVSGGKAVYKVSIPETLECVIYEVGLFSYQSNPASGVYTGGTLSAFNSSEGWESRTGGDLTYTESGARFGGESVSQAVGTEYSSMTSIDLSGYSTTDDFVLSGNLVGASGVCYARVTFVSDEKEISYLVNIGSSSTYVTKAFTKVDTGSTDYLYFDWTSIREIRISVEGTLTKFDWDALRVLDNDTLDPDKVLIGRRVLGSALPKPAGVPLELQYEMDVSV